MIKSAFSNKNVLIVLSLILILGSGLRFYGLGVQSLWVDELASWDRSSWDNLYAVIFMGHFADVHPPGHQILLYFVEKYIGDSETILRFPSAVAGVLAIFMIFLVGAQLYSPREGLIAAALLAVFRYPVYYSQEARSYSLLLLFTLIATYFCIEILRDVQRKVRLRYVTICSYWGAAFIASYLHYFGLFLIFLQCSALLLYSLIKRYGRAPIILICLTLMLGYVPWMPKMWGHLHMGSIWIPPPQNDEFFYFLRKKGSQKFLLKRRTLLNLRLPCSNIKRAISGILVDSEGQKQSSLIFLRKISFWLSTKHFFLLRCGVGKYRDWFSDRAFILVTRCFKAIALRRTDCL